VLAEADAEMKRIRAWSVDQLRQIVFHNLSGENARVFLFGSWARGDIQQSSDIDIAILAKEALAQVTLSRIRDQIEQSTIPYRVDVVDLAVASPALRQAVLNEGIEWTASS
jgi:uncharacterized protein